MNITTTLVELQSWKLMQHCALKRRRYKEILNEHAMLFSFQLTMLIIKKKDHECDNAHWAVHSSSGSATCSASGGGLGGGLNMIFHQCLYWFNACDAVHVDGKYEKMETAVRGRTEKKSREARHTKACSRSVVAVAFGPAPAWPRHPQQCPPRMVGRTVG